MSAARVRVRGRGRGGGRGRGRGRGRVRVSACPFVQERASSRPLRALPDDQSP